MPVYIFTIPDGVFIANRSPLKNSYEKHFRFPCKYVCIFITMCVRMLLCWCCYRDGSTLKVIEEMGESVFNIQIPLELLYVFLSFYVSVRIRAEMSITFRILKLTNDISL